VLVEASVRSKVSIIGAGNTGSATALWLAAKNLCDIVLLDIVPGRAQGKALDLQEAIPILGQSTTIAGTCNFDDTTASDVVIVTAGNPRTPGMSRDDLAQVNAAVVTQTVREVVRRSPDAILIILTNPIDPMAYLAYRVSGFPARRVIGQAGILDSARFQILIAQELGVSVESINAFILGGHGDTMVPMARHSNVCGIPLPDLIPAERLAALTERVRNRGTEIVNLLKTSASYAPGAALAAMVECILLNTHRVLPCSAFCSGEYNLRDLYFGVPVQLGRDGVERIIELPLDAEEQAALDTSAERVREIVSGLSSFYA
jgi:malate dehydrogenase